MQYADPIGTINVVLHGTTICVAAKTELWVKPKNGDAFAVHSIIDQTQTDSPFYDVTVTDYKGNSCDFTDLNKESQCVLCDWAIDQLF